VTRSRSISGASRPITDRWAKLWTCDGSIARQRKSAGRSTTSRKPSRRVQIRYCR